jgi:hypothetical protein
MLDIAATTQVVTGQGHVYRVFIAVANTAAGGIYDSATTGGISTSNLIQAIPVGQALPIELDAEVFTGLVIDPGTGGTVSVTYDPSGA